MYIIKYYHELNERQIYELNDFLEQRKDKILPYQRLPFVKVIDEVFKYENISLIAYNTKGNIEGFLPQWIVGRYIESVPWRDKGGPVFVSPDVIREFEKKCKELLMKNRRIKGVVWKDFRHSSSNQSSYFVNINVDLANRKIDEFYSNLPSKIRGKIRQAERNGLEFRIVKNKNEKELLIFYKLLVENRHRIGVPVYPLSLFQSYFKFFPDEDIMLFNVATADKKVVAAMILLINTGVAIDAYSASSDLGKSLKANDYLVYQILEYCIQKGIKMFDFGADSPHQKSLIDFKLKWMGEKRVILTSFIGEFEEFDHNKPSYDLIKYLIQKFPRPIYRLFSVAVIKSK